LGKFDTAQGGIWAKTQKLKRSISVGTEGQKQGPCPKKDLETKEQKWILKRTGRGDRRPCHITMTSKTLPQIVPTSQCNSKAIHILKAREKGLWDGTIQGKTPQCSHVWPSCPLLFQINRWYPGPWIKILNMLYPPVPKHSLSLIWSKQISSNSINQELKHLWFFLEKLEYSSEV
jgi:hypothetical protein